MCSVLLSAVVTAKAGYFFLITGVFVKAIMQSVTQSHDPNIITSLRPEGTLFTVILYPLTVYIRRDVREQILLYLFYLLPDSLS